MTIEQRTRLFGFERSGKTIDPDPARPFIFKFEKISNISFTTTVTVLNENSIRIDDVMKQTKREPPLPFWFQPFFGVPNTKFLSEEEINDANIQRKRFWGLNKERIIWKP